MNRLRVSAMGLLVAVGASTSEAAEPLRLEDPRYDDHGPGSYIYPTGIWYQRGMYDLRSVEVVVGRSDVTFRVFMELPVQRPDRVMVNANQAISFTNEIYFRNIDIYVDHTPGRGHTEGVPGRNVRFRPEEAWDFVVILTPQPDLVRQILRPWKPSKLGAVYVADVVRSRGQEIWATVPIGYVGAAPDEDAGYQAVVSGALTRNNFEVLDRVVSSFQLNALTMPVFGVAEAEAFGGGDLSRWQPRAIDVLLPKGVTQRQVLGHYDPDTPIFAQLPMVYPSGKKPLAKTSTTPGSGTPDLELQLQLSPTPETPDDGFTYTVIRDVYEQMAILETHPDLDQPYRVGTVLGQQGQEVGRIVVNAIYSDFVQATIVEGLGRVKRGARVRFDPQKEQ